MGYALPRRAFNILEEFIGKQKADEFARELEISIEESKEDLKSKIKDELISREVFLVHCQMVEDKFGHLEKEIDERFKSVDLRFKSIDFKINILIILVIIFGTVLNPSMSQMLRTLLSL